MHHVILNNAPTITKQCTKTLFIYFHAIHALKTKPCKSIINGGTIISYVNYVKDEGSRIEREKGKKIMCIKRTWEKDHILRDFLKYLITKRPKKTLNDVIMHRNSKTMHSDFYLIWYVDRAI